ncbi:MAG: flavodoxin family protein [Melioribacteraceae bacterium]|nr:flavodoxin family protein [Melioribacteraceae bacterium]MCF8265177.1 flavodoxin family protein [Melioribacteraceae bacterium]MCF8412344.1 flavodoxin family protein [Melioribacteraceae bacterium]MCF8432157.1 flavodoxin family protein [Melioribacteraceae bacterium]
MGNILVLYDSASGNTEKMAHYVKKGVESFGENEVRIIKVDDAKYLDVEWCDGLALGSPTNIGIVSWKMKKFWDEMGGELWGKIDGKIGCAFSSQGGWGGGAEITCMSLLTILMNYGFLVFGTTDYVADKFTLHYGPICAGAPREQKEIDACKLLGKRLSQWVSKYIDQKEVKVK